MLCLHFHSSSSPDSHYKGSINPIWWWGMEVEDQPCHSWIINRHKISRSKLKAIDWVVHLNKIIPSITSKINSSLIGTLKITIRTGSNLVHNNLSQCQVLSQGIRAVFHRPRIKPNSRTLLGPRTLYRVVASVLQWTPTTEPNNNMRVPIRQLIVL